MFARAYASVYNRPNKVELIYFICYHMVLCTNYSKIPGMLRTLFLALLLSCNSADTFAQQVTISNNLLYDAWLTPNLRVGFRMAPHWSVGLTGGYRPWPTDDNATRKYRHLLISPSVRYWKDSVTYIVFGVLTLYTAITTLVVSLSRLVFTSQFVMSVAKEIYLPLVFSMAILGL